MLTIIKHKCVSIMGLLHNVPWMSCNPILSGFGRSIESHSGDYGSIFSFQRHQSGATNRRYDIMQQTHNKTRIDCNRAAKPISMSLKRYQPVIITTFDLCTKRFNDFPYFNLIAATARLVRLDLLHQQQPTRDSLSQLFPH